LTPARKARLSVTVFFFAHGTLFGTWAARIPAIKDDLDLSEGVLGLSLLCSTLGSLLAMPLVGALVAREGSRRAMLQAVVAYAALLPCIALAPNVWALAGTLLLFGASLGALDVAMNSHGLEVERRYPEPIFSSFHAGWSFGGLAGATVGALAAWGGVEPLAQFTATAVVLGGGTLLASRWLLESGADRSEETVTFRRPPRRLAGLALLAFCGLFAEGGISDWSAVYTADSLDAGGSLGAIAFGTFAVSMAVSRLFGDRLTTRWGPVALTRRGGALGAIALSVALVVAEPGVAIVAFACVGAGVAAFAPLVFRSAGSLPGIAPSVGLAALTTVGYSAFLVGPPAIGFLAEAVGLPGALTLVVAMLVVTAALAPRVQPAGVPASQPA
jgi:MFS family permease